MTGFRSAFRGAVGTLLGGLVLAGCGTYGASAQGYATRACDAYREIGRDPVAERRGQATALVGVAQSDVRAAAAFDPRWATLSSDMQSAINLMAAPPVDGMRFFRVDRRVQDDCAEAGRDIGDLEP